MPLIWGKGTEIARQFAVRHCMAGLRSSLSRAEEAVRRADQGARKPIAPELRPPSSTFPQAGERSGRAMSAGAKGRERPSNPTIPVIAQIGPIAPLALAEY